MIFFCLVSLLKYDVELKKACCWPRDLLTVCEQKINDESILRSQLDMKTPHHSVSGRSYLASTPDSSNVAVFEVRLYLLGFFSFFFF